MAGLLTISSVMMCPHGGIVQAITTNARVKVGGDFAVRQSDTFVIAGCAFNVAGVLHPCVQVQWVLPAVRSKAIDDLTLTEESVGLCVASDQAVQGMVQVVFTQPRVTGQ